MSKNSLLYLCLLIFTSLIFAASAQAVCPICTVAVCAGVGLSRWLGIDDLISGVWIGGLTVSSISWFLSWLGKNKKEIKFGWIIISAIFYGIVIIPLYISGIIGHPLNKFCYLDKILFGIIFGSLAFIVGVWLHNLMKIKNKKKSFFPFQKVVIPISFLIITSLIFYFFTKG